MITDISICFQAKTFPTRSSLWWRRSAGICFTCWLTSTGLTLKRRWLWSCRDTWTHCTHISSSSSGNSTWSTPRSSASWTTCRRCCAPPCRPTHTTTWPRDEPRASNSRMTTTNRARPSRTGPSVTNSHENWSKDGAESRRSAILIPAQIGVNVSYRTKQSVSILIYTGTLYILLSIFIIVFCACALGGFRFLLGNGVSARLSSVP